MTVNYDSGNLALGPMQFQPAVDETFNARCFQLIASTVYTTAGFTSGGLAPGTLEIEYPTANGTSTSFSVVYGFRVRCLSGTTMLPGVYATIGGPLKYIQGVPSSASSPGHPFVAMLKYPESWAKIDSGGWITWSVLITNGSPVTVELRRITDTLPAGAVFVTTTGASVISQENSFSSPPAYHSGVLAWMGTAGVSYTFGPSSTTKLQYITAIAWSAGLYTNTVTASSGEVQVLTSTARAQLGQATAVTADFVRAESAAPESPATPDWTLAWLSLLPAAFIGGALAVAIKRR